ncbi:MAG: GAF domain-containing protein, partial [Polyangia bacterium]|nr:GAF domain-containing protein [Polyangia bacterium]
TTPLNEEEPPAPQRRVTAARNAAIERPLEPSAKRRTAEMVAMASDFFEKKSPPLLSDGEAPSKLSHGSVSAGELRPRAVIRKPITEPAIIIDADLAAEIEELESLRRTREEAMRPPPGRPLPHKVFKVMAEAPDGPWPQAVRRRYVSVWPNPPDEALKEVLLLQLGQVQTELAGFSGTRRVVIIAFDHAFDGLPDRPPIGLCTWATEGGQDPAPICLLGEDASRAWLTMSSVQPAASGSKDPARTAIVSIPGPELTRSWAEDTQRVLPLGKNSGAVTVKQSGDLPGAPQPAHQGAGPSSIPVPPQAANHPSPETGAVIQRQLAPDTPGQTFPAPSPVAYPPELRIPVYQGNPPAPPPAPPPSYLDPHWGSQAPQASVPVQAAPSQACRQGTPASNAPLASQPAAGHDLAAHTFERMQALFYMTDRGYALAFCLDTALGLIPSQAGAILLYDPAPRELYLAAARGPGDASPIGHRLPVHEGLAGFCAMEGLPLALSYMDQDQRLQSALSGPYGLSVHSILGAPIQFEGRFWGVIELVNRLPEGPYLAEEVNALAYIGRQLAERLATALGG